MPNTGPTKGQERKKMGNLDLFLWATWASFMGIFGLFSFFFFFFSFFFFFRNILAQEHVLGQSTLSLPSFLASRDKVSFERQVEGAVTLFAACEPSSFLFFFFFFFV
jgi:hypothetical protein